MWKPKGMTVMVGRTLIPASVVCPHCESEAPITAAIPIGKATARYDCTGCGQVLIAKIVDDREI